MLDDLYSGAAMDRVFGECEYAKETLRRVVLSGAVDACEAGGFQEFLFDLLSNFPAVSRLSVEWACWEGTEADTLLTVLRQFSQVCPERMVYLEAPEVHAIPACCLVCDLTVEGYTT